MRIRITTLKNGECTTIRVEGRIGSMEATKLLEACRSVEQPIRLNLAGLTSADEAGIRAVRSVQADGAELIGASLYIQRLLNQTTRGRQDTDEE